MIRFIILCFSTLLFCSSCENKVKKIELDYCEMYKKDQSFVAENSNPNLTEEENRIEREKLVIQNFNKLIQFTKEKGFPQTFFKDPEACKFWSISLTLIHTAQMQPELFFHDSTIHLFSKELKSGRLKPELLIPVFKISSRTNVFCKTLEPQIEQSILIWDIPTQFSNSIQYKTCK